MNASHGPSSSEQTQCYRKRNVHCTDVSRQSIVTVKNLFSYWAMTGAFAPERR